MTETYVALRLEVDIWRWAGVPCFIRAGKALAATATAVRVIFKRPPRMAFLDESRHPDPNQLVFRFGPAAVLRLLILSKGPEGTAPKHGPTSGGCALDVVGTASHRSTRLLAVSASAMRPS